MRNPFKADCPPETKFIFVEPKCKLPRFCGVSGHALVMECTQTGYNTCTGERIFERWLHCPDYKGGQYLMVDSMTAYHAKLINQTGTDFASSDRGGYGLYYKDYLDCHMKEMPKPEVKKTKVTEL